MAVDIVNTTMGAFGVAVKSTSNPATVDTLNGKETFTYTLTGKPNKIVILIQKHRV